MHTRVREFDMNTILIVDDTTANIDILVALLTHDYEIRVATNGRKALELAASQHPDLILLDVMMPVMDGYEVCRKLKTDPVLCDIPVIFITALAEEGNELSLIHI